MMRWINLPLLFSLLHLPPSYADEIMLHIGEHEIRAVIANTPAARQNGLMHSHCLCANCGMLFVFPQEGKYHFWMKDTPRPLAIAFISANGSIVNIDEMEANSTQIHSGLNNAMYALEMNQNWFAQHDIKARDHVAGLQQAPPGE